MMAMNRNLSFREDTAFPRSFGVNFATDREVDREGVPLLWDGYLKMPFVKVFR